MTEESSNDQIIKSQVEMNGLYYAEERIQALVNAKQSLFDKDGKIQITAFDPDKIRLNPQRVKLIGEYNDSLSEAEKVTRAILDLRFTI
jgi:hypothetical protein